MSEKIIIERLANSFAKIFLTISEQNMQRVVLAERLKELGVETISELLNYFVTRAEEADVNYKPVINCLMDIPYLVSAFGNAKMSDVYIKLEEKGYYNVCALMLPQPVKRKRMYEDEILSFPDMEQAPLGVKKSLAKSNKKHILEKLIYEENPAIIRNLLNNPKITEKEVLKIITRRPIKKKILMEVVNSKRWLDRYIIKKAIIRNPFTPTDIALNLLHFMLIQDLSVIAKDASLHFSICETADKLITKKKESKL